jgi:hypothetical protein
MDDYNKIKPELYLCREVQAVQRQSAGCKTREQSTLKELGTKHFAGKFSCVLKIPIIDRTQASQGLHNKGQTNVLFLKKKGFLPLSATLAANR